MLEDVSKIMNLFLANINIHFLGVSWDHVVEARAIHFS